jgi:hypothetical protein
MSRGPGKIESAVLEGVERLSAPSTVTLACYAYGIYPGHEADLTPAQLGSVQRALRRLKARGEVVEHVPARASIWRLARTARRDKAPATH